MRTETLPHQERQNPSFLKLTSAERVTVPSSLAGASPMPPVKLWKQDNLTSKKKRRVGVGGRQRGVSDCQGEKRRKKKKQEVNWNSNAPIKITVEVCVQLLRWNGTWTVNRLNNDRKKNNNVRNRMYSKLFSRFDSDQKKPTHTFWTRKCRPTPQTETVDFACTNLDQNTRTSTLHLRRPWLTPLPQCRAHLYLLPPSLPPARRARSWPRCVATAPRRGSTDRKPGGTVRYGGEEEVDEANTGSTRGLLLLLLPPSPRTTRAAPAVASYFSFPPNPAHSFRAIAQFAVMTSQAMRWECHLNGPKVFLFCVSVCPVSKKVWADLSLRFLRNLNINHSLNLEDKTFYFSFSHAC